MQCRPVEMIGEKRATRATLLPAGTEHEMVDDHLAAPIEEIGEPLFALRAIEDVVLFDLDPGQRAPLGA